MSSEIGMNIRNQFYTNPHNTGYVYFFYRTAFQTSLKIQE